MEQAIDSIWQQSAYYPTAEGCNCVKGREKKEKVYKYEWKENSIHIAKIIYLLYLFIL